jgi:drug/metabolite transporter (DMT)-like permease
MSMSVTPADRPRAYVLLAAIIVLWGVNWPIMKVGLQYIPPLWFATARVLLGCACLAALLAARGRLRLPERGDLAVLISVGCLQIGVGLISINVGLLYVEAGRSAILNYTTPLWVAPLAVGFLGERMSPSKVAGLVLGLAGIGVLFDPGTFDFTHVPSLIGNGVLLVGAMVGALVIVHIRRHRWCMAPIELMPWQMLLGGVLLAVAAAVFEGDAPVRWSPTLFAVLAYNGPVASAFCFWAWITVAHGLPAMSTALGSLGVPVAGVLFSAVFLAEPLALPKVLGLALISLGVALVMVADLGRARPAEKG